MTTTKRNIASLPVIALLTLAVAGSACHSSGGGTGASTARLEATIRGTAVSVTVRSQNREVCLGIPSSAKLSGHLSIARSLGGDVGEDVVHFATPSGGGGDALQVGDLCSAPVDADVLSGLTHYPGEFLLVDRPTSGNVQAATVHPAT